MSKLTVREILDVALAQFEDPDIAQTMAAVAIAESFGGKIDAIGDGGSSVGLWQINRIHFQDLIDYGIITAPPEVITSENSKRLWREYAHSQLFDPATNAKAAWMIGWQQEPSRGPVSNAASLEGEFNFTPWSMYNNGRWQTPPENENERYLEGEWVDRAPIDAVFHAYSEIDALDQEGPGIDGIPTEVSTTNPTVNRFSPGINPADRAMIQTATRTGAQAPDYTHTPEMALGYNVLTDSQNLLGFSPQFSKQINAAMNDKYGPNFVPIKGRIGRTEMIKLKRELKGSDPRLAEALGNPKIADFASGDAAIIGYATDEDAAKASKFFRQHGLAVNPEMPFIVTPLGGQPIDSSRDVASQMWDVAIGSLWNTTDDDAGAF